MFTKIGTTELLLILAVALLIFGPTKLPKLGKAMGQTIGAYLKEYGFNMDFAPDADVNTNPDNPIIGTRAFSSDAATAAELARAPPCGDCADAPCQKPDAGEYREKRHGEARECQEDDSQHDHYDPASEQRPAILHLHDCLLVRA